MPDSNTYYITTPIYYVNDRPHIGHAYTSTICDVAARFQRFAGRDVRFLTGTDEHGVKVEKSAAEKGVTPQVLADENAAEFQRVLEMIGISNDDFIRTTEERHVGRVQRFVERLVEADAVYLGEYEGWYDEGQEEFVPENRAKDNEYKSPISGRPLVKAREENFFFRLSAYQERLEQLYADRPDFVRPEARRNEMLGRLREGLQDIPVSRTSFSWGIPVPGHERHVLWVWIDALSNYLTAIDAGEEGADAGGLARFWPADFHVIGKEILFFHAIFWPAMLMALDLPLPKCVYAHSFWIREGRKMSKSLGNFIDLETMQRYLDDFGLDAWRWFMVTQGPLGATDADFAHDKFVEIYNTDLANTLGNSANRVANMITKYFDGVAPTPTDFSVAGFDWPAAAASAVATARDRMDDLDLGGALAVSLDLVRQVDAYIDATRPFTMAKDPEQREALQTVLYNCAEGLRIASLLLWAAMPGKIETMWELYGQSIDPHEGRLFELAEWGRLKPGTKITKGEPLFPRWTD
ncbi:MAG: methionine--tRNA ligase [Phycisphaerales bacterium]